MCFYKENKSNQHATAGTVIIPSDFNFCNFASNMYIFQGQHHMKRHIGTFIERHIIAFYFTSANFSKVVNL